jgi:hypothetical protein
MRGNTPNCHYVGRGQTIYYDSVNPLQLILWQWPTCVAIHGAATTSEVATTIANAILHCVAITSIAT